MNNPFETIDARLSNIETLLIVIKHELIKKLGANALSIPNFVNTFDMSSRLRNILLNGYENFEGITCITDVNIKDFCKWRNVGKKTEYELKNLLKQL